MGRPEIASALARLAPRLPAFERDCVLDHAVDSPTLRRSSPEEAAWLSLVAYVRHTFTDYDDLLGDGYDPDAARYAVRDDMAHVLEGWGVRRRL